MCPNGIHHAARSVSAWRYVGVHCHGSEQCHTHNVEKFAHELHQETVHTLLNTPHDSSAKIKQLRGLYAQTFFTF